MALAPRHTFKIEQGTTFETVLYWRQPVRDLVTGDVLFDDLGNVLIGPPVDLTGYTARMHIRKTIRDADPMLALTTSNGGITISTPAVTMHDYVRAASTTLLDLNGLDVVDGVQTVAGDRILAKDQNDETNGIYIVTSGAWSRADDADVFGEVNAGAAVWVKEGNLNDGVTWRQGANLLSFDDLQVWSPSEVGRILIKATDEQTTTLTSSGVYDIELESAAGDVHRLLEGKIRLSMEVTR